MRTEFHCNRQKVLEVVQVVHTTNSLAETNQHLLLLVQSLTSDLRQHYVWTQMCIPARLSRGWRCPATRQNLNAKRGKFIRQRGSLKCQGRSLYKGPMTRCTMGRFQSKGKWYPHREHNPVPRWACWVEELRYSIPDTSSSFLVLRPSSLFIDPLKSQG